MGMSNTQLELIRSVAEKRLTEIRKYAIACCEEDTTIKNRHEVERYKKILRSDGLTVLEVPAVLRGMVSLEDVSEFNENRYYLSEREKPIVDLIKRMNEVSLQLMEKGIPYLNATLLYGESGTGKTTFGKYVAYKLGLPFMYINFSKLVDSHLGGTAKNLSQVFDFATRNECLLMLDEIDCISLRRSAINDGSGPGAELSRTTISLMQELDKISNRHVIIGATNRPDDIDPALKRRFTEKHEIKKLTEEESVALIWRFIQDTGFEGDGEAIEKFARENHTQAEILTHVIRCMAKALMNGSKQLAI